jgi:hypothetical protein
MAVVIDEMEAAVEPGANTAPSDAGPEHQPVPAKASTEELAADLRRLSRRERRLRAD